MVDPLIAVALAELFPGYTNFAAIDATMLRKYRVFARLGFFGVDPNSLTGAVAFLQAGSAILARDRHAVWVTPQGEFADVRRRPLRLKRGVGHLAARLDRGWVVPVAIEYVFWNERKPEALARIGAPIALAPDGVDGEPTPPNGASPRAWTARIEAALAETLDALNAEALTRDAGLFTTLIGDDAP